MPDHHATSRAVFGVPIEPSDSVPTGTIGALIPREGMKIRDGMNTGTGTGVGTATTEGLGAGLGAAGARSTRSVEAIAVAESAKTLVRLIVGAKNLRRVSTNR
jgi:hypothetical protein